MDITDNANEDNNKWARNIKVIKCCLKIVNY